MEVVRTNRRIKTIWRQDGAIHREDGPAVVLTDKTGHVLVSEWYCRGNKHRVGAPAVIGKYNDKHIEEWYQDGVRHREGGPAVTIIWNDRIIHRYYRAGVRHRDAGPAYIEVACGWMTVEKWYCDDRLHRENGPAIRREWNHDGGTAQEWFLRGMLHRVNGPAVIVETQTTSRHGWYQNGALCARDDGVYEWHETRGGYNNEFKEWRRCDRVDYYVWYHKEFDSVTARVMTFDYKKAPTEHTLLYILTFIDGRVLVNWNYTGPTGDPKWPWLYDILPQPIAEEIEPALVIEIPTLCSWV